jgi:5-methylcytosine-specific restriction protein B
MENVALIFRSLVIDQRSPLEDWKNNYVLLVRELDTIKQRLTANNTILFSDPQLYVGLTITDYSKLLNRVIYQSSNGVSGKGRATIPKKVFDLLHNNPAFEGILKDVFLNPDKKASYLAFRKWWTTFCHTNGSMDFKLLVNRAVAAIHPEIATVTVDEGKFNEVIAELSEECGFPFPSGNWLERNMALTSWLDNKIKAELDELDALNNNDPLIRLFYRNVFTWALYENGTTDLFDLYKQIIKYGPPGTGKTYTCQRNAAYHFENWLTKYNPSYATDFEEHIERIQFHPSFTYEDFIEGLRPVPDQNGKTVLKLVSGIFKSFCKKASLWEREVYAALPDKKEKWEEILVKDVKGKVSGTHWDFINDIDDNEVLDKVIPPFYFIIDEINRGELSRVFGELMFALEYRGYNGKIKTQYAQLATDDETSYWIENNQNFFFIPHNVFLFGTMNTIDRSVESFDFALRRRFRWKEVLPNYAVARLFFKENGCEKFDKLVDNLQALNNKISSDTRLLGKDYQIGHSYLMKMNERIKSMSAPVYTNHLWNNNLFPLLEEYLRGTAEPGEIKNKMQELKAAFVTE